MLYDLEIGTVYDLFSIVIFFANTSTTMYSLNAINVGGCSPEQVGGFCATLDRVVATTEDSDELHKTSVAKSVKMRRGFVGKHSWLVKRIDRVNYNNGRTFVIKQVLSSESSRWSN